MFHGDGTPSIPHPKIVGIVTKKFPEPHRIDDYGFDQLMTHMKYIALRGTKVNKIKQNQLTGTWL